FLEQVTQAGARRRLFGTVVRNRLGLFVHFLRLDGQRDRTRLAVDAGEPGFDFLADLEHGARVFDAVTRELGGAQLAFDAVAEVDDRATRVHFLDGSLDDGALRVRGDPLAERVLRELLDAQRNALTLRVDGQHHGFHLLALLVVAHGFFARDIPREVRQMHEAVDVAGETDEHAEVGDGLDLSRNLVATVEVLGELLPRILLALLEAERNATTLFIHVEHHDFDFLARVHDLGRVDVLVGPVHFGHVDQAFDAVFDLHERAVVGDVRDLAKDTRVRGIATRNVLPWIR